MEFTCYESPLQTLTKTWEACRIFMVTDGSPPERKVSKTTTRALVSFVQPGEGAPGWASWVCMVARSKVSMLEISARVEELVCDQRMSRFCERWRD